MIKVEFKSSANLTKFRIDPRKLERLLTEAASRKMQDTGCEYCHGSNVTVYLNELERKEVRGLYYCHDCNQEGPFILHHNVIDQSEAIVNAAALHIQNEFKKAFSGR